MSDIGNARAGIMQGNESANQALGGIQQAIVSLEETQQFYLKAAEDSGQGDVDEMVGQIKQAIDDLTESQQRVSAAISTAEGVAARL